VSEMDAIVNKLIADYKTANGTQSEPQPRVYRAGELAHTTLSKTTCMKLVKFCFTNWRNWRRTALSQSKSA